MGVEFCTQPIEGRPVEGAESLTSAIRAARRPLLLDVLLARGHHGLLLEQLLGLGSTVGIVTEFAGGIVFIIMLLKGIAR